MLRKRAHANNNVSASARLTRGGVMATMRASRWERIIRAVRNLFRTADDETLRRQSNERATAEQQDWERWNKAWEHNQERARQQLKEHPEVARRLASVTGSH